MQLASQIDGSLLMRTNKVAIGITYALVQGRSWHAYGRPGSASLHSYIIQVVESIARVWKLKSRSRLVRKTITNNCVALTWRWKLQISFINQKSFRRERRRLLNLIYSLSFWPAHINHWSKNFKRDAWGNKKLKKQNNNGYLIIWYICFHLSSCGWQALSCACHLFSVDFKNLPTIFIIFFSTTTSVLNYNFYFNFSRYIYIFYYTLRCTICLGTQ